MGNDQRTTDEWADRPRVTYDQIMRERQAQAPTPPANAIPDKPAQPAYNPRPAQVGQFFAASKGAVNAKISGPSKKVRSFKVPRFLKRKKVLVGTVGVLAVVFGLSYALGLQGGPKKADEPAQVLSETISDSPTFDTLEPSNDITKTESRKFTYYSDKKVASYTDTINNIPVTISQQPLPERFKKDQAGELAKFAEEINAKTKLAVGDITAYVGVSAKGPQTTVFIKNQLLVFIAAEKAVPNTALTGYIAILQ